MQIKLEHIAKNISLISFSPIKQSIEGTMSILLCSLDHLPHLPPPSK